MATKLGSNNEFPKVILVEQGSTPAAPSAGQQKVYIRTSDHHLVRENSSATIVDIEGSAGDVVGPSSAVNLRIAVFDGTTGKLIKDGGQTIADIVAGVGYGALITETVTAGSQATVTFNSIAASWRDLRVVVRGRSNEAALTTFVILRFNNDSGANYDYEDIYMLGTTNGTSNITEGLAQTSVAKAFISGSTATANYAGMVEYLIADYKGTTFQKALKYEYATRWSTTTGTVARGVGSGFWRNTAAITRVDVTLGGGNTFVNGSVVSLYGLL